MICPQCGKRNTLGVQRCRFCRRQFTRSASQPQPGAAAQAGPAPRSSYSAQQGFDPRPPERRQPLSAPEPAVWEEPYVAPPPSQTYVESWEERPPGLRPAAPNPPKRRSGCLLAFGITSIVLVAGLVILLLVATLIVQPMIREAAVDEIGSGVRDEVTRQIDAQLGEELSGDIVISEDEINARLAGEVDLGPLSDAKVEITPDGLLIRLSAYGLNGSYRAQVIDQNGAVAIAGSPMEGPLSYVMPQGEIEEAVNAALAEAISEAGYYVQQVATAEGAITLTLAQ